MSPSSTGTSRTAPVRGIERPLAPSPAQHPGQRAGLLTGALELALEPSWVHGDVHSFAYPLSSGKRGGGIRWSRPLPVSWPPGTSDVPWMRSLVAA